MTPDQKFILVGWQVRPNGCWDWLGSTDSAGGYAIFVVAGETIRAHRFSWERVNGPIPDDLHGLHTCDNRICVNPDHTFPGNDADNVADMDRKGRRVVMRGALHKRAKLTDDAVRRIRANSSISVKCLAKEFGVSPSAVCLVRKGKTWRHVA